MNDEFIRSLQADWRTQGNDTDEILKRLRRNRWTPHIVLGAEILVCVSAFLAGLWFAWVAVHHEQDRLLYVLSAGVMLLTAPVLCVAAVIARRPSLAWDVETPESLLNVGIRRAESSLRAIRIGRWHVAVIAAFVVTLWIAETLGRVQAMDFLIFYTLVCVAVSVASLFWMGWREKGVCSEHAACVRLLAALRADDGNDA